MYHFISSTPAPAAGVGWYNSSKKLFTYYKLPHGSCNPRYDAEYDREVKKMCQERHMEKTQLSKYKGSTVKYVTGLPKGDKYKQNPYMFTLYDAAYLFDPCHLLTIPRCKYQTPSNPSGKPPEQTQPPPPPPAPPVVVQQPAPPPKPPKKKPKQNKPKQEPPVESTPQPVVPTQPVVLPAPEIVFVPTPTYAPPVESTPAPIYSATETRMDTVPEDDEPEEKKEDDNSKMLWVGGILALLAVAGGVGYYATHKNRKKKKR